MAQNISSAVMAQRKEAHDSLDDFPTPPWATRALVEHVLSGCLQIGDLKTLRAWDPTCNRGFMARPLGEYFGEVKATDIHDYGWSGQQATLDFLWPFSGEAISADVDWIIANPPFRLAEEFILKAVSSDILGCAFLLRTAFLESEGRFAELFTRHPPTVVAQFVERVVMHKGKVVNPNIAVAVIDKTTGKTVMRKPSTATSYMWFVWMPSRIGNGGTRLIWIPPCRAALEKEGDYVL